MTRMNQNIFRLLAVFLTGSLFLGSCKKWDDHTAPNQSGLEKNLFQLINENPEMSKFSELLVKSGLDKEIASSKTYTVFAPTNAALAGLDQAIVNDAAKLYQFVGNHISRQLQSTSATGQVRLEMMNGKYHNLQGTAIEGATITVKDVFAKNGYLHTIDKMLAVLPNAWEFVQTSPQMPASQKAFISQTDPSGTNVFLNRVYDLRDEKKQFTLFVLVDTTWDKEVAKYRPFYATGSTDSTTNLASFAVVRDFAVEGLYQAATMPDTLVSKYNTKLGIDKNAIVQSIKISNGIIHIMSKLDVLPRHKFQPLIIQGESYDFARADRRNVTYFRDKFNPVMGKDFRDVLVFNHDIAQFYLGYSLGESPALTYKAYWVAVHDNINSNTGTFKQLLGIGTPTSTTILPYITVSPNNYNEVLLGQFTLSTYRPNFNIYLTADNSTNDDANKITVDYIRLEPVLN